MQTPYELKKKIMRGVYRVYALRKLSHPAVRVGALFALLLAVRELTFVSKVIENASLRGDAIGFANYIFGAFFGTETVVQLVVLAAAAVVAWMAKDLVVALGERRMIAA